MTKFGFNFGPLAYALQRSLRRADRHQRATARRGKRLPRLELKKRSPKAHGNSGYNVPYPPTLVPATKFLFTNQGPRTIFPHGGRGQEDRE